MERRDFIIGSSGILVGSGLLTGYDYLTNSQDNGGNTNFSIENEVNPKIGSNDSDVKLVYWVDFQCPYCYRFSQNQFPQIKSNYIDENNVQMILKPLTIFGEDSQKAAKSMHCVNELNKNAVLPWYKKLHEMYNNASSRNSGWANRSNLLKQTDNISNIKRANLQDCLNNNSYLNKLRSDYEEGDGFGLSGTPFFILYNKNEPSNYSTINGVQRYNLFMSEIEDKL